MSQLPAFTFVPVVGNKNQWRVYTGYATEWEISRGFVYRRHDHHWTNSESKEVFGNRKTAAADLLRSPHTRS